MVGIAEGATLGTVDGWWLALGINDGIADTDDIADNKNIADGVRLGVNEGLLVRSYEGCTETITLSIIESYVGYCIVVVE